MACFFLHAIFPLCFFACYPYFLLPFLSSPPLRLESLLPRLDITPTILLRLDWKYITHHGYSTRCSCFVTTYTTTMAFYHDNLCMYLSHPIHTRSRPCYTRLLGFSLRCDTMLLLLLDQTDLNECLLEYIQPAVAHHPFSPLSRRQCLAQLVAMAFPLLWT